MSASPQNPVDLLSELNGCVGSAPAVRYGVDPGPPDLVVAPSRRQGLFRAKQEAAALATELPLSAGSDHSVDPAKLKHWRLNAFNIRARQRGRLQPRGHRRCPKNLLLQTNPCIPLAVIVTLIVV